MRLNLDPEREVVGDDFLRGSNGYTWETGGDVNCRTGHRAPGQGRDELGIALDGTRDERRPENAEEPKVHGIPDWVTTAMNLEEVMRELEHEKTDGERRRRW